MYYIKKSNNFDSIFIETNNLKVELINYGASIKQIQTKNHKNKFEDLLLEFKNPKDYFNNSIYLNATIGPIAGRIRDGKIKTDKAQYQLEKNQNKQHSLHSSNLGLSSKEFDYEVIDNGTDTKVNFTYRESSFSDLSYTINICYTITDNSIRIDFHVKTKSDFYFNLTNHAYFNLSGNLKNDILDHEVIINTDTYHVLDKDLISTQQLMKSKLYDFTVGKSLRKPLSQLNSHPNQGYDDIYYFQNIDDNQVKASVYDPQSKRLLKMYSTYDHMVFYTHNNINKSPLKHLNDHYRHYGLCFEFQRSPHGYKDGRSPNTYLKAGQEFNDYILFEFSLKN